MKKYHIITVLLTALCLSLCFMSIFVFNIKDMTVAKGEISEFNSGWVLQRPDGSVSELESLPYREDSKAGEVFSIENHIPEEYLGETISFLSADKELRIYVDGEVIYEFGKEDERLFGHTPGSITNFVDLPAECREGIITIECVSPYDGYASNFAPISVGKSNILELLLIKDNLWSYLFCIIILFCAVMMILFEMIDILSRQPFRGVFYLGAISCLGAVYHAIETKSLNIFYGNQTLYSIIVFIVIMIMPVFLCMYYLCNCEEKYIKRIKINLWFCYANIILQIAIQLTDAADFMITAPLSHGMIMVTIINVVIMIDQIIVSRYKETGRFEYRLIFEAVGVAAIMIGSLIDIIRFYVSPVGDMGKYGRIGMLIFSVAMLFIQVRSISTRYLNKIEENVNLMTKMLEEAQEANRQKSIFLANMSHEIRTPMNSIMGFAEILLKQQLPKEESEYVINIRESSQSLLSIINDILDISKIESGKMELVKSDFDTKKLLSSVSMEIKLLAEKKGLDFSAEIDENLPTVLYGDEVRLKEILINLLNNAVKYTAEGSVTFGAKMEKLSDNLINCIFEIKDTGIGISEENQKLIFNAFEQVEQLKNKGIEGTGLGLSIVKGYVTLMNGNIDVISARGEGSTFIFTVPIDVVDASPVGKITIDKVERAKSGIGDIRIENKTALVVDDSIVNLKVIGKTLEHYGIAVETAKSGAKSIEMCKDKQYDMVFMDQMMPEMDGVTAMKHIREIAGYEAGSSCKIFALTANAIKGVEEELVAEGFDAYLSKPIEFNVLEETLTKYY